MENKVTLTMKEQHKLKMVIDYEAGKVRATISSSPALRSGKTSRAILPHLSPLHLYHKTGWQIPEPGIY